jgi:uncharacterized protein (TIGR00661 family)
LIKSKNFQSASKNTKIIVAPLDWGLGHATRCIPIIKELIRANIELFIVVDKTNYILLKEEFPSAVFLRYNGYKIQYSRYKKFFFLKLFLQIPKIIYRVFTENKWLKKIVREYSINAIISDNRFGMYNKKIPSVYITHQLHIETGNKLSNTIAQKIHYFFIKKYNQCWVPDLQINGLAGILSHPQKMLRNATYIGPLSRFKNIPNTQLLFDLLVSISGPEPQRTIFENKILSQLKHFSGKAIFVRGLPSATTKIENFNQIQIENHLSSQDLNRAIEQSKIVISRCGYTSVMDLSALKKKAILVPTPGQSEQEYLAKYLYAKKYFFAVEQDQFYLEEVLKKAAEFNFRPFDFPADEYKKTTDEFVLSIKSMKFAPQ